ncbi:MAG: 50S ribosomal protein L15 [Candidatus Veblenbacteria bacterium]|nr:50S ribosomal protein L15 [Candidatus Veblenbacteria bacterium]
MSLALHNLKANRGARRSRKRLGRGNASGHGTTATRGTKGQRARQGGRKGLIQFGAKHFVSHLPKVRGFESFKAQPQVVTVAALGKFKAGEVVTPELLQRRKLIESASLPVKLIGGGSAPQKLTVKVQVVTGGAQKAITAAGGTVEILPPVKVTIKK